MHGKSLQDNAWQCLVLRSTKQRLYSSNFKEKHKWSLQLCIRRQMLSFLPAASNRALKEVAHIGLQLPQVQLTQLEHITTDSYLGRLLQHILFHCNWQVSKSTTVWHEHNWLCHLCEQKYSLYPSVEEVGYLQVAAIKWTRKTNSLLKPHIITRPHYSVKSFSLNTQQATFLQMRGIWCDTQKTGKSRYTNRE